MTKLEDLALVVQLACMTEDRSDAEQRALLRVARKVDTDWNTTTNRATWGRRFNVAYRLRSDLHLEDMVHESRTLDVGHKVVTLKAKRVRTDAERVDPYELGEPAYG